MNSKPQFPWAFVLVTCTFTWLILLPGILSTRGVFELPFPQYALVVVAQYGPSLTAFVLTFLHEGKPGAKWLLAALLFHVMLYLSNALFPPLNLKPGSDQTAFLYLTVLYVVAATIVVSLWGARRSIKESNNKMVPDE